jgi:hypothetical protein
MTKTSYLLVLLLFLACYFATAPHYIGDTMRYVDDIVGHAQGRETHFWEFGHLLWRPWGYAGYRTLGGLYHRWFGDGPEQAAARFLIQTNFVCSCMALLVLLPLLRRAAPPWAAAAAALAMSCSAPFLDYSHSGASYIPALLFSVLSLRLLAVAAERPKDGRGCALLAGASFAVACALWFPYSFSGLGLALAVCLWPVRDAMAEKRRGVRGWALTGAFLVALAASAAVLFAGGAAAKGIGNASELARWVQESGNGWAQSRTAMRAVSGVARSVWDFGGDAIQLKRWLFHDPYNPASAWAIVAGVGWKLGMFYAGYGAALWALWRERREVLLLLAAAGVPVLLFAIFVFEPSSLERFLPVFPFIYLGFASVLGSRRRRVAWTCVAVFLGAFAVSNLSQHLSGRDNARLAETRTRLTALEDAVRPGGLVFTVTFEDDLYRQPPLHPLDGSLAHPGFTVTDAVEVASARVNRWRAEFVERTLAQWKQGREA